MQRITKNLCKARCEQGFCRGLGSKRRPSYLIKLNRKRTEEIQEVRGRSRMQMARLEEDSPPQTCRLWAHSG